jgi:hypothetical protein
MGRRHLLVFALLIVSVAAVHAGWEAWHAQTRPAAASASPGDSSTVCTACGPMRGAKPTKLADHKNSTAGSHAIDITGLEPYEVDTPHSPIISPTVEGFVPPPSTRPSN